MSRRKRLARSFSVAIIALGLAAPAAQARPLVLSGSAGTPPAAGVPQQVNTHASIAMLMFARSQDRRRSAGQPATRLVAQSSDTGANWTAVALGAGLSVILIGAFGATAYRLHGRRATTA